MYILLINSIHLHEKIYVCHNILILYLKSGHILISFSKICIKNFYISIKYSVSIDGSSLDTLVSNEQSANSILADKMKEHGVKAHDSHLFLIWVNEKS